MRWAARALSRRQAVRTDARDTRTQVRVRGFHRRCECSVGSNATLMTRERTPGRCRVARAEQRQRSEQLWVSAGRTAVGSELERETRRTRGSDLKLPRTQAVRHGPAHAAHWPREIGTSVMHKWEDDQLRTKVRPLDRVSAAVLLMHARRRLALLLGRLGLSAVEHLEELCHAMPHARVHVRLSSSGDARTRRRTFEHLMW